jgi:hypothetical protein
MRGFRSLIPGIMALLGGYVFASMFFMALPAYAGESAASQVGAEKKLPHTFWDAEKKTNPFAKKIVCYLRAESGGIENSGKATHLASLSLLEGKTDRLVLHASPPASEKVKAVLYLDGKQVIATKKVIAGGYLFEKEGLTALLKKGNALSFQYLTDKEGQNISHFSLKGLPAAENYCAGTGPKPKRMAYTTVSPAASADSSSASGASATAEGKKKGDSSSTRP